MAKPDTINIHADQKYIDALLNNDTPLLEELYLNCSGKIKRMVEQNNGSESDAADIFQDALLAVYNKAKDGSFRLTCPMEAFLYLVCRNRWLNVLNRKSIHKVTFTDTEGFNISEDSIKLAETCTLQLERKKLLEEKLEQLGDTCKKLLHLSWSGISMDKVAAQLNVSYGYARKKKSECMGKLIRLVQQSPRFNSLKW